MDIVELLAKLDWFESAAALLRWLMGTRSHRFMVPRTACSGQHLENLLKSHGIPVWDRKFNRNCWLFRVKVQQARWATYLMQRAGIPVVNPYKGK